MSLSTKSSRRRTLISSFVFTPEEAKYLKAVLRWNAAPEDTPSQRRPQAPAPSPPQHAPPPPPPPPSNTPQLRLLILGAPSVGKTTLLNRVRPPSLPSYSNPQMLTGPHSSPPPSKSTTPPTPSSPPPSPSPTPSQSTSPRPSPPPTPPSCSTPSATPRPSRRCSPARSSARMRRGRDTP